MRGGRTCGHIDHLMDKVHAGGHVCFEEATEVVVLVAASAFVAGELWLGHLAGVEATHALVSPVRHAALALVASAAHISIGHLKKGLPLKLSHVDECV